MRSKWVAILAVWAFARGTAAAHMDGVVMQLELPDVESTVFLRLTDYADKPMLLNFWSSDCPPCLAEMPMLFQQAPKQPGVQFLGVAVDDRLKARRFLASQHVSYPQAVAPVETDGLMRRFGNPSGALPYTVVLNRKHQICSAKRGAVDSAWVANAVPAKKSTLYDVYYVNKWVLRFSKHSQPPNSPSS